MHFLEETFINIADILQLAIPTKIAVVRFNTARRSLRYGSTVGTYEQGKFRGFNLHAAVNQLGLPLRALVTPGNSYDGPFLPRLIED